MPKAFIKIAYKQVIDASSGTLFEKNILHASYEEYKMKQQAYNTDGSITTFTSLKAKDGRANSLHYKSGFAVGGFIEALKNTITVLQDNAEQPFVFDIYRFEVIESDITNVLLHKVAIHYISATLTLYEIIGDYLLLVRGDKNIENADEPAETFLVKVQPGMTIVSYKEIKNL
jgi:hypothetical protein